jgi:hypothetical protein
LFGIALWVSALTMTCVCSEGGADTTRADEAASTAIDSVAQGGAPVESVADVDVIAASAGCGRKYFGGPYKALMSVFQAGGGGGVYSGKSLHNLACSDRKVSAVVKGEVIPGLSGRQHYSETMPESFIPTLGTVITYVCLVIPSISTTSWSSGRILSLKTIMCSSGTKRRKRFV